MWGERGREGGGMALVVSCFGWFWFCLVVEEVSLFLWRFPISKTYDCLRFFTARSKTIRHVVNFYDFLLHEVKILRENYM